MIDFKKLAVKYLRELASKIEADATDISESDAIDIMGIIAHQAMSKEQACTYLNLSRSRFDDLVKEKKIPKGRKRTGFRELVWYRDELDICKNRK